jgi:hypothetical protein
MLRECTDSKKDWPHIRTLVRKRRVGRSCWPNPGHAGIGPSSFGVPGSLPVALSHSLRVDGATVLTRPEVFRKPHLASRFLYICSLQARTTVESVRLQLPWDPHRQGPAAKNEKNFVLRRLEAMFLLHKLHDVPQLPALTNVEPLDLGVHGCPLAMRGHYLRLRHGGRNVPVRPKHERSGVHGSEKKRARPHKPVRTFTFGEIFGVKEAETQRRMINRARLESGHCTSNDSQSNCRK